MKTANELMTEAREIREEVARQYPTISDCQIRWNYRMRTTGGRAFHRFRKIELSYHLFVEKSIENQSHFHNVVLHELAHIIVGPGHGHDGMWRHIARSIGCTGDRCHTMKVTRNRRKPKVEATCHKCGNIMRLGPTQAKRHISHFNATGRHLYSHKVCVGV